VYERDVGYEGTGCRESGRKGGRNKFTTNWELYFFELCISPSFRVGCIRVVKTHVVEDIPDYDCRTLSLLPCPTVIQFPQFNRLSSSPTPFTPLSSRPRPNLQIPYILYTLQPLTSRSLVPIRRISPSLVE